MQARWGCWFKPESSEQWLLTMSETVLDFSKQNSPVPEHSHFAYSACWYLTLYSRVHTDTSKTTRTAVTHWVCNPVDVTLAPKSHVRDVREQLWATVGLGPSSWALLIRKLPAVWGPQLTLRFITSYSSLLRPPLGGPLLQWPAAALGSAAWV